MTPTKNTTLGEKHPDFPSEPSQEATSKWMFVAVKYIFFLVYYFSLTQQHCPSPPTLPGLYVGKNLNFFSLFAIFLTYFTSVLLSLCTFLISLSKAL